MPQEWIQCCAQHTSRGLPVFGLPKTLKVLPLSFTLFAIFAFSGDSRAQVSGQMVASCPITVAAGGKGAITGTVTDWQHVPLDSVEVVVVSAHKQAMTDAKGVFRIEKLDPTKIYQVMARRFGYV